MLEIKVILKKKQFFKTIFGGVIYLNLFFKRLNLFVLIFYYVIFLYFFYLDTHSYLRYCDHVCNKINTLNENEDVKIEHKK